MKKNVAFVLPLVGIVAVVGVFLWSRQRHEPIENRIPDLTAQLEKVRAETEAAVKSYIPKTPGRIDDRSISASDLLRQLPGVLNVESEKTWDGPTHRIIHLRDWHFVPKDIYLTSMESFHGRKLSQDEKDRLFREFLLEVEIVQVEQMGLLRCLIRHHGLKAVFSEGVYEDGIANFRKNIEGLRGIVTQLDELEGQLREVRDVLKSARGDRKEKAQGIEKEILAGMDELTPVVLQFGAAGRLMMTKELAVMPLENAALEKSTNPYSPDGKFRIDPAKVAIRDSAMVKIAMRKTSTAVIILGGSHDLSAAVRGFSKDCEYVRVTTKGYPK